MFAWSNVRLTALLLWSPPVLFRWLGVTSRQSAGYSRLGFRQRARLLGGKKNKVAWMTLIPFSLPSVLFVFLSSVNFHTYVCFSAMPSQLSASCLLGSLQVFFFFFFFLQDSVFTFFFRSLSLCRRDCGLTEVQILCFFIHFFHLFLFIHPAYFSLLPGDTLSILILN